MRLGIAITRARNVEPTWTTAHIATRALEMGHSVRFIEPWDYEVDPGGRLVARAHAFEVSEDGPVDRERLCAMLRDRAARRRFVEVTALDALLIRINPLDTAVLTFAMAVKDAGVVVLNDPATLMWTSHKEFLAGLSDVPRPATLVSRSRATIHAFFEGQDHGVVVKPARSSGGKGIARVDRGRSDALDRALDHARAIGDGYLVVQEYLPEAEQGETRLVWLDGAILGSYVRQRAPGEFRHNLKRGGRPEAHEPGPEYDKLIETLTPHLRRCGVWLAGIDVIGGRVLEINTLNPGGLHLIQEFSGRDLSRPIVDALQACVDHAGRS
ncbi:MAG: hypothetical protein GY913_11480 [Proteobacteria bacterium]|nr:hypothetical protein [Pseudomonadota bacterium]MCP4917536.1 hypothetical protein [Pseudomonadota bacterium]